MIDLRLGFKIYDNDCFLKFGLGPEQAADLLADLGATFVTMGLLYATSPPILRSALLVSTIFAHHATDRDVGTIRWKRPQVSATS